MGQAGVRHRTSLPPWRASSPTPPALQPPHNGQFPGLGSSCRNETPCGTRYVTTVCAGAPLSLRAGAPVRLVDSVSSNPVWSPDGAFILYSGTPRGRSVPVKAVSPDGRPFTVPSLTVDRVGDSFRFLPTGQLVVKLGGFRQQDFWLFDLATGAKRRLTTLDRGESLQRFDVSRDGTRIVFERLRENSDIVLIELAAR